MSSCRESAKTTIRKTIARLAVTLGMLSKLPKIGLVLCCAAVVLFTACGEIKREVRFEGRTMGTTYHVKVIAGWLQRTAHLKEQIEQRLAQINQSMSTYLEDSEISRFNALETPGRQFKISSDFLQVMKVAQRLHALTDGAWDGTVHPLVLLWGFGGKDRQPTVPEDAAIAAARQKVGFQHIDILEDGYLLKHQPQVTLDLASIAKGFGVDQLALLLRQAGFADFLVEIGGEVYAAGRRKDRKPWRVGINTPRKGAPVSQIYTALDLQEAAMATSGDYRNFFEVQGRVYSHVLDPRTGYPVTNGLVSVSVRAGTCTLADGLATALMVMGHEQGLALLERLEQVEGLFVIQSPDGQLQNYATPGFFSDQT